MTATVSREIQTILGKMHLNANLHAVPQSNCFCHRCPHSTAPTPRPIPGQGNSPHVGIPDAEHPGNFGDSPVAPAPPPPTLAESRSRTVSAPIPGVSIPDLGHGESAWLKAVKQWEEGDSSIGFKALKDWPKSWYTGVMRTKFGAKRSNRKIIALEYERLGRDDTRFREEYPDADRGVDKLLKSIRQRNERQRNSKNGTPEERLRA